MPGKVKVKIIAGRNLPVMDRSSDTTDAYVEIKLGSVTYKTDVCRKSLNPQWNSEWYRFEVDDAELQDEPLQIRLMDYDTYSANDAIGKVYLDLNPLLLPSSGLLPKLGYHEQNSSNENITNSMMSGWFPVYDTMHGIRGEVNIVVKVELFTDFNKFRQSSCGVQFFCSPIIPLGHTVQVIHGFVEELVVNDDPEYQWIDKIRTPRASNEARQVLFLKLSGELQRKIGVKALELGGNAVVGYSQSFDLEGESGIVARGIGTAVSLLKIRDNLPSITPQQPLDNIDERALNYLKFLGSSSSFYLNKTCDNQNSQLNRKSFLPFSSLNTENPFDVGGREHFNKSRYTRHLSTIEFQRGHQNVAPVRSASSMQSLLKQEDFRRNPGRGISQKFRNLKYASHSMLSKKMSALRARISETGPVQENYALGESSSSPALNQSGELKNKNNIFKRSTSDSSVMAELLIHSLMRSSLECIEESGGGSPKEAEINETKAEEAACQLKTILDDDASEKDSTSESTDSDDESDSKDEKSIDYETVSSIIKSIEIIESRRSMELGTTRSNENIPFETDNISCYSKDLPPEDIQKFTAELAQTNLERSETIMQPSTKKNDVANEEQLSELQRQEIIEIFQDDSLGIPPLAEPEDFLIHEHKISQTEVPNKSDLLTSGNNKNTNFECSPPKLRPKRSKFFIPPVRIRGNIDTKSLMQTAMQTMLLEKVNIIGTYTPPLSPALDRDEEFGHEGAFVDPPALKVTTPTNVSTPASSSCSLEKDQSFYPQIAKTFEILRRSPTAVSLGEHNTEEKVTPASFTSLDNLNKDTPTEVKQKVNKLKSFEKLLHHKGLAIGHLLKEKVTDLLSHTRKQSIKEKQSVVSIPEIPITPKEITCTNFVSSPSCDVENTPETPLNANCDKSLNTKIDDGSSNSFNTLHASLTHPNRTGGSLILEVARSEQGHQRAESTGSKMAHSPVKFITAPYIHRRSSDSDLSITPKGNSFTGSDKSGGMISNMLKTGTLIRSNIPQDNLDMLEYPFLTMSRYPPGFILCIGGAVSARSVKLLERISNLEEPESRDTWWSELRMEIRSHARTLNCNAVLGYSEATSICDDVCVLSASGTAAVISYHCLGDADAFSGIPLIPKMYNKDTLVSSLERNDLEKEKKNLDGPVSLTGNSTAKQVHDSPEHDSNSNLNTPPCSLCHTPYGGNSGPLRTTIFKCALCRNSKVPDILITTVELPEDLPTSGKGCFLQAHVCRQLKDLRGESNAKDISDGLPFLEYELHRLLVNKLRVKGMNAIFGLKVRISVGVRVLIGIATGTAVFLLPLPSSPPPKLVSDRSTNAKKLAEMQKLLNETVRKNKEIYQIKSEEPNGRVAFSDNEDEGSESPGLDLAAENKDCCILEADDPEDIELMNLLMEPQPPDGFHVVNTEQVPGLTELEIVKNLQMFMQIWRAKLHPPFNLGKLLHKLLQTVYFKLRRMIPCALCDLQFRVDLPESDDIQLVVLGMALGLAEPKSKPKVKNKGPTSKDPSKKNDDDYLIFNMEEFQSMEPSQVPSLSHHSFKLKNKQKSPERETAIAQKVIKGGWS
ncbi:uncharacterized protein LOC108738216 isoform X2 [Agrilus planipennis]|uniref:Uncharacterized protein LOC108738216 isoform X2 n=1 Tax=Agrilus planipennis TaxID=224129 RepID=A0A1W4X3W0_AGRPL|nr:uncharacterized protein LOC108738216 isoform X2 [Agrilus planipennis]